MDLDGEGRTGASSSLASWGWSCSSGWKSVESARRGGNGRYRTGDEGEFEEDVPLAWVVPAAQGPMSIVYGRPPAHSIVHREAPPETAGRNYVRYPGA